MAEHLSHLHQRLARAGRYRLLTARAQLTELAQHGALIRIEDVIRRRAQRLDDLVHRMKAHYREALAEYRSRLDVAATRILHYDFRQSLTMNGKRLEAAVEDMARAMRYITTAHQAQLSRYAAQLDALSPMKILERGYALVWDENGALLKDVTQTAPGARISARVAHGTLEAKVTEIKEE